jgi:hypothetical protein
LPRAALHGESHRQAGIVTPLHRFAAFCLGWLLCGSGVYCISQGARLLIIWWRAS